MIHSNYCGVPKQKLQFISIAGGKKAEIQVWAGQEDDQASIEIRWNLSLDGTIASSDGSPINCHGTEKPMTELVTALTAYCSYHLLCNTNPPMITVETHQAHENDVSLNLCAGNPECSTAGTIVILTPVRVISLRKLIEIKSV